MKIEDCFELGYISKPHGVRGDLKAVINSDDITKFKKIKSVFLDQKGKLIFFSVVSIRIMSDRELVIHLGEVNDRNTAELLRGSRLFLPASKLPELTGKQFYYHEVIGFLAIDTKLGPIGTILDIYEMPGQDLILLDHNGKEVMLPITERTVGEPDRDEKTIPVTLPEGLLDIYL